MEQHARYLREGMTLSSVAVDGAFADPNIQPVVKTKTQSINEITVKSPVLLVHGVFSTASFWISSFEYPELPRHCRDMI